MEKITKHDRMQVKGIVCTFLLIQTRQKYIQAFGPNDGLYLNWLPLFFRPLRKMMVKELLPIHVSGNWPPDHTDLLTAMMIKIMARQGWKWPRSRDEQHTPGVCPHCGGKSFGKTAGIRASLTEESKYRCDPCGGEWTETWTFSHSTKL